MTHEDQLHEAYRIWQERLKRRDPDAHNRDKNWEEAGKNLEEEEKWQTGTVGR